MLDWWRRYFTQLYEGACRLPHYGSFLVIDKGRKKGQIGASHTFTQVLLLLLIRGNKIGSAPRSPSRTLINHVHICCHSRRNEEKGTGNNAVWTQIWHANCLIETKWKTRQTNYLVTVVAERCIGSLVAPDKWKELINTADSRAVNSTTVTLSSIINATACKLV